MNLETLHKEKLILLECISGSKAYGLATPTSDTDVKGVFLYPKQKFYGLDYTPQVNNPSNDIVFYELKRFIELLSVNNPNILELLNTPPSCILQKHPILDKVQPEMFISKLCKNTFAKYAMAQIKKAKGLNKKILNPVGKIKKSPLDFCYVNFQHGSVTLSNYLEKRTWHQENCGLNNIPHMKNTYGLYYSESQEYQGILRSQKSNELCLSSIPENEKQQAILYFNQDGYSKYCKEYKEYWQWVSNRNEARYENTKSHGKNYDAKNMMHTFRLLEMAIEIAKEGIIQVRRPNRDFLLGIKNGDYEYEDLLKMAKEKQLEIEEAFGKSSLPEEPNLELINELLFEIREDLY